MVDGWLMADVMMADFFCSAPGLTYNALSGLVLFVLFIPGVAPRSSV